MRGIHSTLFDVAGAFFRWWFGELAALVPVVMRDRVWSNGERLLLEEGKLYRLKGRRATLLDKAKASPEKAKAVILALPPSAVVTRPTQLPLAAEENLHEVVGFEMDRLTPFAREEVYYACRVIRRDAKAGLLSVDVLLAPRRKVDSLLADLHDQGLRIAAMDVASDTPGRPLGVNLLPQTAKPASSRLGRAFASILTAAAAVLLVVALQVPLQRKAEYAATLDTQLAAERARVAVLQSLREEIASLDIPQSSLQGLKRENSLALALLDRVTRLLPDDAWLNQLSLNGDRLEIAGYSPSSSKLITTFEQSPQFAGALFRAPVTQDSRLGLERFSLSMRVVPEAER